MKAKQKNKSLNGRHVFCVALILLALMVTAGCPANRVKEKDPFFDKWRAKATESRGFSPSTKRRAIDLPEVGGHKNGAIDGMHDPEQGTSQSRPTKALPKKKMTMKMNQTDVVVILRTLARAVDENIMVGESVNGKMSINMKDAPWDQIFLAVLRSNGFTYSWEGDIIRIITLQDAEKNIRQLEAEQKIKFKKKEMELVEPLVTRVIHIDYSDAGMLKKTLQKFLSKKMDGTPIGSVMVDTYTNALIIHAIRSDIEGMIPLIEELDRATPQILIEAHIVETTKETARELGIQWGWLFRDGNIVNRWGSNIGGIEVGSPDVTPFSTPSDLPINFPGLLEGSGLSLGTALINSGRSIVAAHLSALQKEGKLNIISSPSITTLDNQMAIIEAGEQVPYQTVEDFSVQIEWQKAVLSLVVTPHVIGGDTLKLSIDARQDQLDFSNPVNGNPTIITKHAETNVVLLDGQTTVIAGLTQNISNNSESGTPGLKDVPVVEWLFKETSKQSVMDDVLIFVTPHILKEKSVSSKPSTK